MLFTDDSLVSKARGKSWAVVVMDPGLMPETGAGEGVRRLHALAVE
jgi:hypothetical protein